ncbi:MAG: DUF2344 domain-containing protein [Elusimicrobia bacterium]|nr:DUF2344 domain-containing protein [Elusimicrobiota bacterium]
MESQRDVTSFGDGSTAGGLGRRLEQAVRDLCRDSQKRLWEAALINQGAGQSGASDIMGRLGLEAGTGNLPLIAYHSWERTFAAAGPAQDAGGRRIYAGTARRTASLRARLVRHGWSRFVSHLEQIQIFKNAVLLAGLPAARSRTKKPRLKMSFGPAVGVGWESSSEFFDIMLEEPVQIETFSERLKSCLPLGYELGWVGRIPVYFPSLEESANRADFWIEEKYEPGGVDWQRLFEWFRRLSQEGREPLIVKKEKPGKKIDLINVAEIVAAVSLGISQSGGNVGVKLSLRYGPKKNLKPEKILEISLGLTPEFIETRLRICRTALALESRDGRLRYL